MINEEDAAKHVGLPSEQRFYLTERLARERLSEAQRDEWPVFNDCDYMVQVLAAAEAFGIDELTGWQTPDDNDRELCRSFRAHATKVSQKLMLKYAGVPVSDPNTVALDEATKEKVRHHLGQVRSIVDKAAVPDWKKQEIYEAISALELEIDKARTRVAALLDVLGKVWEGEVKAIDGLRKIVMIIQDAKAKEVERAKLAPPPEPKRLLGPARKALAVQACKPKKSGGVDRTLDDEVPF